MITFLGLEKVDAVFRFRLKKGPKQSILIKVELFHSTYQFGCTCGTILALLLKSGITFSNFVEAKTAPPLEQIEPGVGNHLYPCNVTLPIPFCPIQKHCCILDLKLCLPSLYL